MGRNKWTPEQQQAISARAGTLLVSAAAGSGKTSVLVQRVMEYITGDEDPCGMDELLVVTFTKTAAAEMKQRIAGRLTLFWRKVLMTPGCRGKKYCWTAPVSAPSTAFVRT